MPELPDVEAARRCLERTAAGRVVADVGEVDPYVARGVDRVRLREALLGARLGETRRIGKNLFVELGGDGSGPWLALHLGMTGSIRAIDPAEDVPERSRLTLRFEDGSGLALVDQRRLGRAVLASSPEEFARRHGLGPDALDPQLTADAFLERVRRRRGKVKPALMDQSLVAGIGNVYADEILYQARIAPDVPLAELDEAARRRLYRSVRGVLRRANEAEARPERMPEGWLLMRRREGASCPGACGGTVARTRIAGRSSYWCPRCQGRS